jgi:hypothetical protein
MCSPRYINGSFWVRIGKFWNLKLMFCDWIYALKVVSGLSLNLLEQLVMTHFERLRSMCEHFTYLCSLVICDMMCCILSVIIVRSFVYVVVVYVEDDVL